MGALAKLLLGLSTWLGGLASGIMYYVHMVAWARRAFIVALGAAFLTAVSVCASSLLAMISTAGLPSRFVMGLGMFIPSNAVAVMACLSSVYLACLVYRLKLEALRW